MMRDEKDREIFKISSIRIDQGMSRALSCVSNLLNDLLNRGLKSVISSAMIFILVESEFYKQFNNGKKYV
jgi:hypothetical protein